MKDATTNKCTKCGELKDRSCFYKNKKNKSGLFSYCKPCMKTYSQSDKVISAQKAYNQSAKGLATRRAYRQSDSGKEKKRDYDQTDNRKAAIKLYKQQNKLKLVAQMAINSAVQAKTIIKPSDCSLCGAIPYQLHGHHDDYSKPMDVRWLCSKCHMEWHRENGPGLNGGGE